jgi:hypothetical protein
MRQLRSIALCLLTWLTAAMMLVAGTPHYSCRCPSGAIKPFCLGISFARAKDAQQTANCCCNGRCCPSQGTKSCVSSAREPKSCCGCCGDRGSKPTRGRPDAGGQVNGACCIRTLAPSQTITVSPPKTGVAAGETFGQFIAFDASRSQLPICVGRCDCREHQRPPPTDLVVSLLHLVI